MSIVISDELWIHFTEDKRMEDHQIIKLIKDSGLLPQIPEGFGDTLNLLLDPVRYSTEMCIDSIIGSPNLEKSMIKALNGSGRLIKPIKTIQEAVVYLGLKNLRIIMVSYLSNLLVSDIANTKAFNSKKYWRHCIGTSIAAAMIAEETGLSNADKMFTYGLVHDVGVTVLKICLPEHLDQIYDMQIKGVHQVVAERIVLKGITHAEIGQWICEECGLNEEISDVVGYHHTPFLSKEHSTEVKIMHLADSISTYYYEKLLGNETNLIYSERIREELKLPKDFINEAALLLPGRIDNFNQTIGLTLNL
ncbi:MAG: HDOD domain-containing protein [Mobilitalea sp.]